MNKMHKDEENILCQVIGSGECLVTVWADVRSFLCVGSHVSEGYMSAARLET